MFYWTVWPFECRELYYLCLNHNIPRISLFTWFSKTGLPQKNKQKKQQQQTRKAKMIRFDSYSPSQNFLFSYLFSNVFLQILIKKLYSLTHIVLLRILHNLPSKVHSFYFKYSLKIWIRAWRLYLCDQVQHGLTNTVLLEKFDQLLQKTYMVRSSLYFSNISSKFWPRGITIWPKLPL